ncbi:LysR family transcriptional regulator [Pseudorhodoferax sp.]|uniref:LysR family transcriptional regulator n=1 Tax=Pseudorhodoferax sp. TaxID=1993553 RepID=UPI0039E58891
MKPTSISGLLTLFSLVAEHGSIAGAARQLNIAPSLATRQLASLESAFDARFFERTTRSMKLTEAGEMALAWARQSLETQEQLVDRLAALRSAPAGLIRMVAVHYAAVAYLPSLLGRFSELYPQIRISITTTDSHVNLVEQHFDLAIQSGRIADSSIVGQRVRPYQRVLCATPRYLQRHGTPGTPQDLARHRCLTHSANEARNWFFQRGRSLVSQQITPFVEVDNYALLLALARESVGIARIARTLIREELAAGALVPLLPQYACVYADGEVPGLWVLYPNRHVLGRTRLLIDFLVRHLPGMMESG